MATKINSSDLVGAPQISHLSGSNSFTNLAITTATANTFAQANIKGIIRIGATGGTLQPAIGFQQAAISANLAYNSYFKIRALGTDTLTTIGRWD
jgi:hypothetical protein